MYIIVYIYIVDGYMAMAIGCFFQTHSTHGIEGFTSPSLAAWCSRRPPNSSFHSAIPIENGDLWWIYPLKMVIYSGFTDWKWWFSIVMLVYQRIMRRVSHFKADFEVATAEQRDIWPTMVDSLGVWTIPKWGEHLSQINFFTGPITTLLAETDHFLATPKI